LPWDGAVIVSAHPGLEDRAERVARMERDAEWAAKALKGEWREFLEEWNGQAVLKDCGSRIADCGLEMADRAKLEGRRRSVARSFVDWSLGVQEPLWGRLGEIGCPVLWVAGERDGKFSELAGRAVESGGFGSWIAPGAGHRVPWESPAFPEVVGEFLERPVS
jgi:2-succinyl-6-hydroxy-2,4-cyclohexadiene-1-carboxylate synthase